MRFLISKEDDIARAKQHLGVLKIDGTRRYIYDVKQYHRPRSTNQNRLYWMWLSVIESETGTPREDVHEFLKRKFLEPRTITVGGETLKIPGSTTKLDTAEFCKYMDCVQQWAGEEQSTVLPDPSMRGYDEMVAHFGGGT